MRSPSQAAWTLLGPRRLLRLRQPDAEPVGQAVGKELRGPVPGRLRSNDQWLGPSSRWEAVQGPGHLVKAADYYRTVHQHRSMLKARVFVAPQLAPRQPPQAVRLGPGQLACSPFPGGDRPACSQRWRRRRLAGPKWLISRLPHPGGITPRKSAPRATCAYGRMSAQLTRPRA